MGLFLNAAAAVTPTESAVEKSLLHCEGVNNQTYVCETGHCCGESQCCSYYYELWWFWLVWALILILSCFCVCHHRRTKHRLQQQQRQHEINLIAYREAHNYTSVPFYFRFLPSYLLPDYEEVVNRPPTPPPPYSASHSGPSTVASSPQAPEQQEGHCPVLQSTPVPQVSEGLCSTPSMEDLELHSLDFRPKPETKRMQTAQDPGVILLPDALQEELVSQLKGSGNEDDSSKDPLLKDLGLSECCAEDKDRLRGGRRRRFTGDSGIEVCVCGTRGSSSCGGAGGPGQEGREFRELESLLSREGDEQQQEEEESGNFCESCSHRASFAEEEQVMASLERRSTRGQSGSPLTAQQVSSASPHPPVCLLLQTISEQEGAHQSTSTEPQG